MVVLMGLTAFLVRLFIDLDLLEANKWLYIFHLTVLVQWALIIVPFRKMDALPLSLICYVFCKAERGIMCQ